MPNIGPPGPQLSSPDLGKVLLMVKTVGVEKRKKVTSENNVLLSSGVQKSCTAVLLKEIFRIK